MVYCNLPLLYIGMKHVRTAYKHYLKNFDTYYALQNYRTAEIKISKYNKDSKKYKKYNKIMQESKKYLKKQADGDWAYSSKNAKLKLPE